MGLRYGLLAALTLVLASALLWDRLHPPAGNRLFPRDEPAREDLAVLVVGGAPKPEPLPAAGPAAAAADSAADTSGGQDEVTVEHGDTLSSLAQRTLGTSRKAADLAKFNGIRLDAPLRIGQVLRIPPPAPPTGPAAAGPAGAAPSAATPAPVPTPAEAAKSCTVAHGDTLYALAKRYYGDGGKFRRIAEANGLDPEEPLRVGVELRIP